MVLETLIELCVAEPDFLEKLVPSKLGKRPKIGFFEFGR